MNPELLNTIKAALDPVTKTKAIRFVDDRIFNFKAMGNKVGVRSITIRNFGDYDLVLQDVLEVIPPGASFVTGSILTCNEQFQVKFGDRNPEVLEADAKKRAVLRYHVDVCN
jgi:hypothetical protein